ncbi:adenylate/guanylate cyclase domain-containing protein [Trichothermofontia sichuanensis B231]|uniref:adenylate/guanylate cyclase domain-containing protein n=1 Tax=Trichothermofontia sichuanensis TaxID=3045816 RepID=UPI0022450852|nr:adenylate/guanylate cyclase domain-containing protein [Trichothermofontia sichuanensis]UZQ54649.1 adenylate/guanylate cyclase domain-containing protein [Trichothermofontia sichuanensis B231]
MSRQLSTLLGLCKARLSWQITAWVFLSIVAIEVIIFIPSYYRRERELLQQLGEVAVATVTSLKRATMQQEVSTSEVIDKVKFLTENTEILGAAVYDRQGQPVATFGEVPELGYPNFQAGQQEVRQLNAAGTRLDVAWPAAMIDNQHALILRVDATSVPRELMAFAGRITGLVVIISLVVTLTTMVVLGVIVITPILRLRDNLILAGEALNRDEYMAHFHTLPTHRRDELGEVMVAFEQMYQRVWTEIQSRKASEAALRLEQEKSERLLLNILPATIVAQLKESPQTIAQRFEEATILFADLVDFSGLASQMSPTDLVDLLNQIFSTFDQLAEKHGLEKIKTIGDAYMAVGGLPLPQANHTEAVADMALDMQQAIGQFQRTDGQPFHLRIGINTGPVVAGVIGIKKFIYDLWGDAVNVASRMESQGRVNSIQVTQAVYDRLQSTYVFEERGMIQVKGRGDMMTYFLKGKQHGAEVC